MSLLNWILFPFALFGAVGMLDVLRFKGQIGVKLAALLGRGA